MGVARSSASASGKLSRAAADGYLEISTEVRLKAMGVENNTGIDVHSQGGGHCSASTVNSKPPRRSRTDFSWDIFDDQLERLRQCLAH